MPQPGDTTEKPKRDIARFTRNPGDDRWSPPEFLPSPINTSAQEGRPALSPDGRWLVFSSDRADGTEGGEDLWICERTGVGQRWSEPMNLGPQVNSRGWEGQPSFSPDGRTIYFASNRRGQNRGTGLYTTSRESGDDAWSRAVEIFPGDDAPVRVMNPIISSDDRVMLFNCNGEHGGEGKFDVWMCERTSPHVAWSTPINIGQPINTKGHEFTRALSHDGRLLLFRRIPPEGKESEQHGYWSVRRVRKSQSESVAKAITAPPSHEHLDSQPGPSDNDGWTPLFNGIDLTGWHTVYSKADVWRKEKDEIVCRRKRGSEQGATGWLATDEDYMNFELELEYNLERGDNSGVFLRAIPGEARNGADQLEVQLLDDNAANFRDKLTEDKITGAVYGIVPVSHRTRVQPKKWNQLAIRLVGDQITVTVNGDVVTDADIRRANPDVYQRRQFDKPGPIGLQWHGSKTRYRNLRIRRLDAEGQVIPAGEGQPGKPGLFQRSSAE